ncbi:MAG: DUF1540 domain-containing protein [Oscillospiraceae bacterium]
MDQDKIYGVSCDVSNCMYNRENSECVAGKIKVHCSCNDPDSCQETLCHTFKPRTH